MFYVDIHVSHDINLHLLFLQYATTGHSQLDTRRNALRCSQADSERVFDYCSGTTAKTLIDHIVNQHKNGVAPARMNATNFLLVCNGYRWPELDHGLAELRTSG